MYHKSSAVVNLPALGISQPNRSSAHYTIIEQICGGWSEFSYKFQIDSSLIDDGLFIYTTTAIKSMITDRVNRVLDAESLAYLACVMERISACVYRFRIHNVLILREKKIKNKKINKLIFKMENSCPTQRDTHRHTHTWIVWLKEWGTFMGSH